MGRCNGRPQFSGGMMLCVTFNPATPTAGALTAARRGATAHDEKRSPTRATARNPNVRSFIVTSSVVARGKRLKAARRESCRIIRDLGSGNQIDTAISSTIEAHNRNSRAAAARTDLPNLRRGKLAVTLFRSRPDQDARPATSSPQPSRR